MGLFGEGLGMLGKGLKKAVNVAEDFLPWTEEVTYIDEATNGVIKLAKYPDGRTTVIELEVPKEFRGKGVGKKLQAQAMSDNPNLSGQVSSKKAATSAYNLGRRPIDNPNATLDDVYAAIDDMSSVNMATPDAINAFNSVESPAGLLDMSTAARKQRADDMGFDTDKDWYHGTADDIEGFLKSKRGSGTQANSAKKAFWFTDDAETTAKSYADHSGTTNKVAALLKDADVAERAGNWDLYDEKLRAAEELESFFMGVPENRLQGQNIIPTKLPKEESLFVVDMKGGSFEDGAFGGVNEALDKAKADGYKGVKFLNLDDAVGLNDSPATHVAIFEPQNIRSKFAKFDPAKASSSNLLASNPVATAAAGAGGILALQPDKAQAAPAQQQESGGINGLLSSIINSDFFGSNDERSVQQSRITPALMEYARRVEDWKSKGWVLPSMPDTSSGVQGLLSQINAADQESLRRSKQGYVPTPQEQGLLNVTPIVDLLI